MPERSVISSKAPIAVFDSGLGGLTVVAALRRRLPSEEFIYFGDTARVPYGNKSAETVARFTREICEFLLHFEPKCIIAACHTVSATVIADIRRSMPTPVLDVVAPGARIAAEHSRREIVAVLGTEATIASGAYERAIRDHHPRIRVVQQSCPLFVPLVEEGRQADDPLTALAVRDYLKPIKRLKPDVVLLGCTHYPILTAALQSFFGSETRLVDPGEAVAASAAALLAEQDLLYPQDRSGSVQCYVSDFPQRFAAIGSRFLGEPLPHVLRASAETWHLGETTPNRAASA